MTGPGSGDASRMRIAGIVLLAVAGVAAVVGLLALGGEGPSTTNAAAPGTSSPAPLPGAGGVTPPPPPAPPAAPAALPPAAPLPPGPGGPPVGAPAAGAPIVVPDGGGAGGAGGAGGPAAAGGGAPAGATSSAAVPVRVLNNSTITGLADRAAAEMRAEGWDVVEVGNYPQGVIPTSTVYYRPGTEEQAAAESAARTFDIRSAPRFDGIEGASPGLIVIATNNWGQDAS